MSREIMVPLDGTRFAEAALPAAMERARRDGARLHLVTVWQPLPSPESSSSWEKERTEWQQQDRKQLEDYLRETAVKVAETSGVEVTIDFLEGGVREVLPRWSAESEVDLAVMTTHGRGPLTRAWLGSVADRMVRKGDHPVLLIHPASADPKPEAAPRAFRRVLVPLDGSDLSESALQESLLAGESHEVELTLLRVIPFSGSSIPSYLPEAIPLTEEVLEDSKKAAEGYLLEIAGRLGGWARRVETRVLTNQRVPDAIVNFAAEEEVDLIAMATHGRGGPARALMGSVADKVVRNSTVPVLLFPPKLEHAPPRRELVLDPARAGID